MAEKVEFSPIIQSFFVNVIARVVILVFVIAAFSTQYWSASVAGYTYSYSLTYLQKCFPTTGCSNTPYYDVWIFPAPLKTASTWGVTVLSLFIVFHVSFIILSLIWILTLRSQELFWPYRVYYTMLVDLILIAISIVFNILMAQNSFNYLNPIGLSNVNWSAGFALSIVVTILQAAPLVLSFDTAVKLYEANVVAAHGVAGLVPAPSRKRIEHDQMQHV